MKKIFLLLLIVCAQLCFGQCPLYELLNDLKDPKLAAEFNKKPELVSSWLAVKHLPDAVRLNIVDLEIVSDYMKRSSKSAGDVAKEIPESVNDAKKWLGDKKIEPFLSGSPKIATIKNNPPPGYNIAIQDDGTLYIRRNSKTDTYTPQLTVKDGVIVKYTGPDRVSLPGKLNDNLKTKYGIDMPVNHQGHHVVPDNVVKDSPLYQYARGKGWYDIDRSGNGVWLAETADDFVDGVSKNLPNYPTGNSPTHLGSHPEYDKLINGNITDVLKANGIDNPKSFDFSTLDQKKIESMLNDIEDLSMDVLEKWSNAHLN